MSTTAPTLVGRQGDCIYIHAGLNIVVEGDPPQTTSMDANVHRGNRSLATFHNKVTCVYSTATFVAYNRRLGDLSSANRQGSHSRQRNFKMKSCCCQPGVANLYAWPTHIVL